MLPIRTILHPTDFSAPSAEALRVACAVARDYGARVVVLHVGAIPVGLGIEGALAVDMETYEEGLREELRNLEMPDPLVPVLRRLSMAPNAAAEIVRVAEAEPCDLIVIGTHGRTGLSRVLMGSVAEGVLRAAPCPVLTVRAPFPGMAKAKPLATATAR